MKNKNTLNNTGAKSIDSFFGTLSLQVASNVNTTKTLIDVENSNSLNKDYVLANLLQHKILYSHNEIKNKIDNLSENEVVEIFKIVKTNNEKYSTNKNGIFCNLSTFKKNTIQEISNFLYFCDNNNKVINEEELERTKYKNMMLNE